LAKSTSSRLGSYDGQYDIAGRFPPSMERIPYAKAFSNNRRNKPDCSINEFPGTCWVGAYDKTDHLISRWRIDGKTLVRFPRLSSSVTDYSN